MQLSLNNLGQQKRKIFFQVIQIILEPQPSDPLANMEHFLAMAHKRYNHLFPELHECSVRWT